MLDLERKEHLKGTFRHEALFYAGDADLVKQAASFVRGGLEQDEAILVALRSHKIEMLRDELGPDADGVRFAEMEEVGRNPARIIPLWRAFVTEQAAAEWRFRGMGEPIWAERSAAELAEAQRHETLLNVAFDGAPAWWLVCPYDTASLPGPVLDEAARSHPILTRGGDRLDSGTYRGLASASAPFDDPLPDPPGAFEEMSFVDGDLRSVRGFVSRYAASQGLDPDRAADLVLAVNEVATNSVRYGGGGGTLRLWRTEGWLTSEIWDEGRIEDPMVGRVRPETARTVGYGLWLVNQLCELVQVRTFPAGSVVRLHLSLT